jgi:hypothetical protein
MRENAILIISLPRHTRKGLEASPFLSAAGGPQSSSVQQRRTCLKQPSRWKPYYYKQHTAILRRIYTVPLKVHPDLIYQIAFCYILCSVRAWSPALKTEADVHYFATMSRGKYSVLGEIN